MLRHLLESNSFTKNETELLLTVAENISKHPEEYRELARYKRLATLFYESSTRTRISFETAMQKLGGDVIGFPSAEVSSASKGESVEDTIRVIQCYADIVAMRHPKEGTARLASEYSRIPIINAGDGSNEHPSQTMLDLYTIKQRLGRLDNFVIGFCGDLKYGRTVHSLTQILNKYYSGIEFYFISPEELRMPDRFLSENMQYSVSDNLEATIDKLDILYMTRIQQERFSSQEEYMRFNGVYVLDENKMKRAKDNMAVLHPFPRVNEITLEVDKDPRAAYFDQVQNGLYIRMALIMALLGIKDPISGQLILAL